MYPDRLVIRNPDGLYGPVEVGSLGTSTVTSSRNRALLKILEDTPSGDGHMVCENRGTGIARMLIALGAAGMEPPRFTDDIATFTVEFPNRTLLDEPAIARLTSLGLPSLSRPKSGAVMSGRRLTANEQRILRTLAGGPLLRAEVESLTGLTNDQVKHALQTLRQKNLVRMLGKPRSRGTRWSVTESGNSG